MSMKNSNDTIGNRTRDLPVCSAVIPRLLLVFYCSSYIEANGVLFNKIINKIMIPRKNSYTACLNHFCWNSISTEDRIAERYRDFAKDWTTRSYIYKMGKRFYIPQNTQINSGAHRASYFVGKAMGA
jgi:hypothetical protein